MRSERMKRGNSGTAVRKLWLNGGGERRGLERRKETSEKWGRDTRRKFRLNGGGERRK